MTARASGQLYTAEMLSLATELAKSPPNPELPLQGSARSATCGGSLVLDLELSDGRVSDIGMLVQACAVGQASAALFARWVQGQEASDVAKSQTEVETWLAGDAPLPSAPDLTAIGAARGFPGRHGAIVLPWRAFADALCKADG